ncbi:hypothetical protein GPL15_15760, partial [Clostridium sp. MCC353]|uniref:RQC domain-containing protein n=1 Tax=Clostridium sp. MCC353 TaxID=2592646 RepID=UPI0023DECBC9
AQRPQLEPAGRMPGAQRPPLESSGRMLGAQKLPLEPAGRTSTAQPPIEPEESESTPAIQSLIKPEEKANPVIFSEKLPDDYIEIQRADVKPVMYNGYDLNELIFTVVKTLQNVSRVRYYGAAMLNDVLRGTVTKRIIDSNLDKIPEFGILKEFQHETVRSIIEWMIKEHLILRTKERYPVLHSTYEGLHYSEKMTEGKLKKLKTYLEEGT